MAKSKNSKPTIESVTKGSRVKRRNVHAQIAIDRRGAGAGFHSKRGYSRKVKHSNRVEY